MLNDKNILIHLAITKSSKKEMEAVITRFIL